MKNKTLLSSLLLTIMLGNFQVNGIDNHKSKISKTQTSSNNYKDTTSIRRRYLKNKTIGKKITDDDVKKKTENNLKDVKQKEESKETDMKNVLEEDKKNVEKQTQKFINIMKRYKNIPTNAQESQNVYTNIIKNNSRKLRESKEKEKNIKKQLEKRIEEQKIKNKIMEKNLFKKEKKMLQELQKDFFEAQENFNNIQLFKKTDIAATANFYGSNELEEYYNIGSYFQEKWKDYIKYELEKIKLNLEAESEELVKKISKYYKKDKNKVEKYSKELRKINEILKNDNFEIENLNTLKIDFKKNLFKTDQKFNANSIINRIQSHAKDMLESLEKMKKVYEEYKSLEDTIKNKDLLDSELNKIGKTIDIKKNIVDSYHLTKDLVENIKIFPSETINIIPTHKEEVVNKMLEINEISKRNTELTPLEKIRQEINIKEIVYNFFKKIIYFVSYRRVKPMIERYIEKPIKIINPIIKENEYDENLFRSSDIQPGENYENEIDNHYIDYDDIDSRTAQSENYDDLGYDINPEIIDNEEYIERINTILPRHEKNNI